MKKAVWVFLLVMVIHLGFSGRGMAAEMAPPPQPAETPEPLSFSVSPALQDIQLHSRAQLDAVVVRIDFTNRDGLATLTGALDIWEVHHDEGYVIALITQDQWAWLRLLGYTVTLDETRTAELNRPLVRSAGQTQGIPGYACYRTVEETYDTLAGLAADHPDIAEWKDIGDTYDKVTAGGPSGYDLNALILTNRGNGNLVSREDKGKFVILAAVHAREFTTAELATRFAEQLVAGYGVDADTTWLLDYNEIHIIAQGNPDGRKWAEQGYSWRKNTNNPTACSFPYYGIDLNRNAGFLWAGCPASGCSSSDPCSILYRGTAPASEPETQAVQSYMQSVFADQRGDALTDAAPIDTNGVFISLHSYGNLVIYSWDWTGQDAPNMPELRRFGRKLGFSNRYSVCNTSSCLYAVDGSHTDYAYGNFGVATYTIEMGTSFFQSCPSFESTIARSNLDALFYAAKAARRPYQRSAGPDSLDLTVSAQSVAAGAAVTLHVTADDTRYFSNGYGVEPVQPIHAVRYSLDRPVWAGGVPVSLTAQDGSFNSSIEGASVVIDTTGWSTGRHMLFVESQDTDNNWGVLSAIFLDVGGATHGLTLAQHSPNTAATAGQTITHTLQITNTGSADDSYVFSVEVANWPTTAPASTLPIAPGAMAEVPVVVAIPATVGAGDSDVAIVRAASVADPSQVLIATLPLTIDESNLSDADFQRRFYMPLIWR